MSTPLSYKTSKNELNMQISFLPYNITNYSKPIMFNLLYVRIFYI